MNNDTLTRMNTLANGFANERVSGVLDDIEMTLNPSTLPLWNRTAAEKVIGKMLATAYAKGYADRVEEITPRRLIF